jgi:hypothetical protein
MLQMLDLIGLPDALSIDSSSLVNSRSSALHMTSALRCPVFRNNKNYSGTAGPVQSLKTARSLRRMANTYLGPELAAVPKALILPLGRAVEGSLCILVASGSLDPARAYWVFRIPPALMGTGIGNSGRTGRL